MTGASKRLATAQRCTRHPSSLSEAVRRTVTLDSSSWGIVCWSFERGNTNLLLQEATQ